MSDSDHTLCELENAWRDILPSTVLTATRHIGDYSHELSPAEQRTASAYPHRRRDEYSTSRAAIHQLVDAQVSEWRGVLIGEEGEPRWPNGWTGSITHSRGICSVAVCRAQHACSIGIDLEMLGRVHTGLWRKIASNTEMETLQAQCDRLALDPNEAMTLLFSAKEAYFKYQFPSQRRWLGFLDVQLQLHPDTGGLSIVTKDRQYETGIMEAFQVRFAKTRQHLLTAVTPV